MTEPCWLCQGKGAIARHGMWSEQLGSTVWVAHRPSSRSHPVRECPACEARALAATLDKVRRLLSPP